MLQVIEVKANKDLDEIRKLFEEYAVSLEISLDFQDFDAELANLPGEYAPPEGCLLMALWEEQVAGCVALRKFGSGTCEMKRLYVRPRFRGRGFGKDLAVAVIQAARDIGYVVMKLDTLPSMEAAVALYESFGFVESDSYRYNPIEGAKYMELDLSRQ